MYKRGQEYMQLFTKLSKKHIIREKLAGLEVIYSIEGKKGKIIEYDNQRIIIEIDRGQVEFTDRVLNYLVMPSMKKSVKEEIIVANKELKCNSNYINKKMYDDWKYKYIHLYNNLKNIDNNLLKQVVDINTYENIIELKFHFQTYESIKEYNENFVKEEKIKFKHTFDNVGGICLDDDQREVIIKDEINHLVLAGAGCGKTTLICGKINYIMERYKINPSEILVISYSKKSASDLKNKLNRSRLTKNMEVSTIHKFGKNIIEAVEGKKISNKDSKEIRNLVKNIFEDLLENDTEFKKDAIDLYTTYKYPMYKDKNIQVKYNQLISKGKKFITVKGEYVRSYEELMIANFLFRYGVKYRYEERYEYNNNYKPDFYLPDYNIYIEHYGIDKNNEVSDKIKDKEKYKNGIYLKRQIHEKNKTPLIETFTYMRQANQLQNILKHKLWIQGVRFEEVGSNIICNRIKATLENDPIIDLLYNSLLLLKSNDNIYRYIFSQDRRIGMYSIKNCNYTYSSYREKILINMLKKIYILYEKNLNIDRNIDFTDMIKKSTKYILDNRLNLKYKYVIVDEYQDITNCINVLIKSICKNSNCKLLCVGDDWQSIFRFAGSDVGIIRRFCEENTYSAISYIKHTYRFDEDLVQISNKFILKNKDNLPKEILSKKKSLYEQCLIVRDITKAIDKIESKEKGNKVSLFIIGRYNEDIDIIKKNKKYREYFKFDKKDNITYNKNENFDIKFHTAHNSKGLEADYVIIINCDKGSIHNNLKGFPSEIESDPIFDRLLDIGEGINDNSEQINIKEMEERRLFYVAMTRAKKQVYLNLPKDENASEYINDIKKIKSCMK